MSDKRKIAIFKANISPFRGREAFWLISKNQMEHIVTEINIRSIPFAERHLEGVAAWQGLVVPVVNLEKFFNIKAAKKIKTEKRMLVRTSVQGGKGTAARLLINLPYGIKVKPLEDDFKPASIPVSEIEALGLKGAYEWGKDKLFLVPDLDKIAAGGVKKQS